jgi:hypothetical protein
MKSIFLLLLNITTYVFSAKASLPVCRPYYDYFKQLCRCSKNITHTNGGTYTLTLTYEVSSNTSCGNWEGAADAWLAVTFMGIPVVDGPPTAYAFENICGPNTVPTARRVNLKQTP